MVLELISHKMVLPLRLALDPVLVELTLVKFLPRELPQMEYECEGEIMKTD